MKQGRRHKSVLGLDIGSHAVKLVEVKHTKKGPIVTYAQSMPIPHAETDDPAANDEAVRETLHALVSQSKMRGKRVVAAVPSAFEEQVTMRSIFIPDLPIDAPKEVLQMNVRAEFEAQDYIAYGDEAEIAFHIEGEMTLDGLRGLEVFVVAVHHDLIEKHVQLIQDCGLIPVAVDVDFLALVRLIVATAQLSEADDIAILDLGGKKTAVGFYQHGKLYPYPHIPFAGVHLTSQVAQYLNIDWDEAEAYKHSGRKNPDDAGNMEDVTVWEALEVSLDQELYQQLYNRFDAYIREFPEFNPSKVIISGGTAQLARLDEFFASRLSVPFDVLYYLDRIPVDARGEVAALKGNEPLFSTAVGLGLKRKW